jgi:hypothetical protein
MHFLLLLLIFLYIFYIFLYLFPMWQVYTRPTSASDFLKIFSVCSQFELKAIFESQETTF